MKYYIFICLHLIIFFAWLTGVSVHSYGQGYQTFKSEQIRISSESKFKIGPFYLFPAFDMNLGYDNNIYLKNVESDPITDYVARFSPQITAYIISPNSMILSFAEIPEYVYYFELENERGWNNTFSFDGKFLLLNRLVLSGNYRSSSVKQRPSSEFDILTYVNTNLITGRLFYETYRDTSIGVSFSERDLSYEDVIESIGDIAYASALDRKERSANVEFYYKIFSDSQFFIRAGYTKYKFDNPEAQFKNSHSYEVRSGLLLPLLGRIRGMLSLGFKKLIPDEEGKTGYSGPVGDTSLEMSLRRLNLRLFYYRDIPFSYGRNIYFKENRYGVGISYYFGQSFKVNYDSSYGVSDYPGESSIQLQNGNDEEIERTRTYWIHRAGFAYRIYENLGFGLSVDKWMRIRNNSDAKTENLIIGIYLAYDF